MLCGTQITHALSYFIAVGAQTPAGASFGLAEILVYDDSSVTSELVAVIPVVVVYVSEEERGAIIVDQGQLATVRWSGELVDHRYVDKTTERVMESSLGQSTATGQCPEYILSSAPMLNTCTMWMFNRSCSFVTVVTLLPIWTQP